MNILIKTSFIIAAAIFPLFASANAIGDSFVVGMFEFTINSTDYNTVSVSRYLPEEYINTPTRLLEFPNNVSYGDTEYAVTEIGSLNLFSNDSFDGNENSSIHEILIPDNVKKICDNAFCAFDATKVDVSIGSGIKEIGHEAFYQIRGHITILASEPPSVCNDSFSWAEYGILSQGGSPDFFVSPEFIDKYINSSDWECYLSNIFAIGSFNFAQSYYGDFLLQSSQKTDSEQYAEIRFVNDTQSKIISAECQNETPDFADISFMYPENDNYCNVNIRSKAIPGIELFTINCTTEDGNVYSKSFNVEITDDSSVIKSISDDAAETSEIYTIQGIKLNQTEKELDEGVYIIKSGNQIFKKILR